MSDSPNEAPHLDTNEVQSEHLIGQLPFNAGDDHLNTYQDWEPANTNGPGGFSRQGTDLPSDCEPLIALLNHYTDINKSLLRGMTTPIIVPSQPTFHYPNLPLEPTSTRGIHGSGKKMRMIHSEIKRLLITYNQT